MAMEFLQYVAARTADNYQYMSEIIRSVLYPISPQSRHLSNSTWTGLYLNHNLGK